MAACLIKLSYEGAFSPPGRRTGNARGQGQPRVSCQAQGPQRREDGALRPSTLPPPLGRAAHWKASQPGWGCGSFLEAQGSLVRSEMLPGMAAMRVTKVTMTFTMCQALQLSELIQPSQDLTR